jgi:anion-transporting  ArsA/GET3 family ATPase
VAHRVDLPGDCAGTLQAMMLDASTAAIAMVERLLPDPRLRDEVLGNRIYRAFLPTLQASPDYIALELICELASDPRFDLLVLDTPPMHNALDFLKAGHTLSSFINERVLKWFAKVPMPGATRKSGGLLGLIGAGGSMAMSVLGRLFGSESLPDIAQFFSHFQEVLPRLKERALATDAMLRSPSTRFVVVTAPGQTSLREARHLHQQLRQHGIDTSGFIVNRVLDIPAALHSADHPQLAALLQRTGLPPARVDNIAAALSHAADRLRHLGQADAAQLGELQQLAGPRGFCAAVSQREGDIHQLHELQRLGATMLTAAASRDGAGVVQ